jgi:hypothetical protein
MGQRSLEQRPGNDPPRGFQTDLINAHPRFRPRFDVFSALRDFVPKTAQERELEELGGGQDSGLQKKTDVEEDKLPEAA